MYGLPSRPSDLLLLLAARGVRGFGDGFTAIVLPAYLVAIGFGTAAVGIVAAASLLGSALFTLGVGMLAPRHELRHLLLAGAALMVATGLGLTGENLIWLKVGRPVDALHRTARRLKLKGSKGVPMPGLDETKEFVPLKIAVLTISDTRSLKDDKSGALLVQRIVAAGHFVAERSIVPDDVEAIRARVKAWIADPVIDAIITTGGTGFTGRDVTPEAVEPLFDKKMDAFSALFLVVSFPKIGTSAIQSRATAGVAGATYIFCLPGSPGACKDAWDEILLHQLDYRYQPCNFVEIMPRLDEHLRRPKAQGATV